MEAYELFPIGMTILTVFASKQNIRKLGCRNILIRTDSFALEKIILPVICMNNNITINQITLPSQKTDMASIFAKSLRCR